MSVTVSQLDVLARLLDAAGLRQRVIAQNLANLNTPNYQRLDVSFEDEMARQVSAGETTVSAEVRPHVIESDSPSARPDGNTVSLETEMSALNKNALLYKTVTQVLTARLNTLRLAISGR